MDVGDLSSRFETEEFIRLIGAALKFIGLDSTAAALESEAQLQVNSEPVNQFRAHILNGHWEECLRVVADIATPDSEARARYALLKQKYLELLQQSRNINATLGAALATIQEMAALNIVDNEEIEKLCLCFIPDVASIDVPARADLLPLLDKLLPSVLLVEKRLLELVEQALVSQIDSCIYHNSLPQKISLFRNHECGVDQLPINIVQTVKAHNSPICHLRFSKKGDFLASSDQIEAIVWEVYLGQLIQKRKFSGSGFITHISWDPEGVQLVICGEKGVQVWDIVSGNLLCEFGKNNVTTLSCAWSTDEHGRDVIITCDNDDTINEWTPQGNERRRWDDKPNLKTDLFISSNKEFVLASDVNTLTLFNTQTSEEKRIVEESCHLISFGLSSDRNSLLISLSNNTLSLWNIQGCRPQQTRFFDAADIIDFNNGVCFGGFNDAFVSGASRDTKVRIWHRYSGHLVATLKGHACSVEAVSWNPTAPSMLVTGGEDGVVLVWGTEAANAD